MYDVVPDQGEESKKDALTVSQALRAAKTSLESFVVTVEGEVSEFNNKAGYKAVYFTVKDEHASMPCMMWANRFASAGVNVQVGSLVRMTGRFTLYAAKGRMNFEAFSLRLAGEGELRARVADLARRLQAEGLMDPQRKKPVPKYMQTIGVVTSPRGAAVHDVLRTLRRRFPVARILLAGVPVEGKGVPQNLMRGMQAVAEAGAEAVLLVRGGGSFEDFMPFNDEELARFIAAFPLPVVTGIGHEPDTCIADMVADLRASTPTAAAEAVSPKRENLATGFDNAARRMKAALGATLQTQASRLDLLGSASVFRDESALLSANALKLDALSDSLYRSIPQNVKRDEAALQVAQTKLASFAERAFQRENAQMQQASLRLAAVGKSFLEPRRSQVALLASRLNDLSPLTVLSRGYAIAYGGEGNVVRSVSDLSEGSSVSLTLVDGSATCTVDSLCKTQRVQIDLEEV